MTDSEKPKAKDWIRKLKRRTFMEGTAKAACGAGLLGLAIGMYAKRASSRPADAIRPPGALEEQDFLASCTRCGLCVRDCPFDTLRLAELGEEVATGTPYFVARETPCEMCDDIPCVAACPTGALDPALQDIDEARMGLALVTDQKHCLAYRGLRCEVCFNVCPLRGEAITLELQHNRRSTKHALFIPVVHPDACTGCGLCEKACVLEEAAIRVLPHDLITGELGRHYRFGWEEQEEAGGSLVTPDVEHRYNLPEGMRYEHGGRGLIVEDGGGATPYADNPMDTLNRGIQEAK